MSRRYSAYLEELRWSQDPKFALLCLVCCVHPGTAKNRKFCGEHLGWQKICSDFTKRRTILRSNCRETHKIHLWSKHLKHFFMSVQYLKIHLPKKYLQLDKSQKNFTYGSSSRYWVAPVATQNFWTSVSHTVGISRPLRWCTENDTGAPAAEELWDVNK